MVNIYNKSVDINLKTLAKLIIMPNHKQSQKIGGKTYQTLKEWRDANGNTILHHFFKKNIESGFKSTLYNFIIYKYTYTPRILSQLIKDIGYIPNKDRDIALIRAIENEDIIDEKLKSYLEIYIQNQQSKHRRSNLKCAFELSKHKQTDLSKRAILLHNTANPNISKLLEFAIKNNRIEAADLLLKSGADPTKTNNRGYTAIDIAAQTNNKCIIIFLLNNLNQHDGQQLLSKSLHCAIQNNKHTLVQDLCNDLYIPQIINRQEKNGNTLLHHAIRNNNVEAVKILLQKGADYTVQNTSNLTPICYAEQNGHQEIIDYLLNKRDHDDQKKYLLYHSLNFAIQHKNNSLIKRLCNSNNHFIREVINAEDADQNTLLHHAIRNNNVKAVKRLLEKGADYTVKNKNSLTPICYAAYYGNKKIIDLLLNKINDNEQQKYLLYHSLNFAIQKKNNSLIKHLCNSNNHFIREVINAEDQNKETLLRKISISDNSYEIIKIMTSSEPSIPLHTKQWLNELNQSNTKAPKIVKYRNPSLAPSEKDIILDEEQQKTNIPGTTEIMRTIDHNNNTTPNYTPHKQHSSIQPQTPLKQIKNQNGKTKRPQKTLVRPSCKINHTHLEQRSPSTQPKSLV